VDPIGWSPLHYALGGDVFVTSERDTCRKKRLAPRELPKTYAKSSDDRRMEIAQVLLAAVAKMHGVAMREKLVGNSGFDVHCPYTPLSLSCQYGHFGGCRLLLQHGAASSVNVLDKIGSRSALWHCVEKSPSVQTRATVDYTRMDLDALHAHLALPDGLDRLAGVPLGPLGSLGDTEEGKGGGGGGRARKTRVAAAARTRRERTAARGVCRSRTVYAPWWRMRTGAWGRALAWRSGRRGCCRIGRRGSGATP
jgi:hypothetical protein